MDAFLKRKQENTAESTGSNKKQKLDVCPHAEKCYRKNPHHFKEYEHPHLNNFLKDGAPEGPNKKLYEDQLEILKPLLGIKSKSAGMEVKSEESVASSSSTTTGTKVPTSGTMLEKLQNAAPYNYFFTTIPKSPDTLTHPTSITFSDLLCPSLGQLKCSLQINFMIDILWLMEQYKARNLHKKPITVVYGDDWPDMKEFMDKFLPNAKYHLVKMKDPFGCHHSKIGIYMYDDNSLRIVVSTANLYYEDWNNYNQGLWLSPKCARLPDSSADSDGESPTAFKSTLLNYLESYSLPILSEWIDNVKRADFSAVKVFLVTSSPGKYSPKRSDGCHLHRVADLLSRHCGLPVKAGPGSEGPLEWGINAQSSSMGSMGKSPSEWLRSTFLRSLSAHNKATLTTNSAAHLNVIFPTVENVLNGYWGPQSGGCLPYSKQTNEKQRWFQDYLHEWQANKLKRTKAMPHIKSYCRVSPCLTKLAWFLLTSANISKSAWGGNLQKDGSIYVRSYEAGVLFLPKFFDEEYFQIEETDEMKKKNLFPFMYDLPLVPYKSTDYPFCQ